ncbi:MAG: hypothetical protein ABJB98_09215 [Actinomycetota bacterium]
MTGPWIDDDLELVAALKAALAPVPDSFVQAGKAAFAWHNIDAELAALTYDSASDALAGVGTRAEPAALRCLTFDTSSITIELEIIDRVLHGQVVPAQTGTVELRHSGGEVTTAQIDEAGYFSLGPLPDGRFRLHCRTDDVSVLTDWITM